VLSKLENFLSAEVSIFMSYTARENVPESSTHLFGTDNDYAQMFQMIIGFGISQVVHTAALYSLAEHLSETARSAEEIAQKESLNVDATFRLLRACASLGLVTYDGHSKFTATPLLKTLHMDDPNSLRGTALAQPSAGIWRPWGNLSDAIRTGEPQAVAALGQSSWEYYADHPAEAQAFTESMNRFTAGVARDAARLIDTRSVDLAVDIGGASGTLVLALMSANPGLRGVVFDLPHVVPDALKTADLAGLQDRFSVVGGDFFKSIPAADFYLLKWILHDWADDNCITILRNCRKSIRPGGRLIVVEMLVDKIGLPGIAPLADPTMMVALGGRERSLDEYTALLATADFGVTDVVHTSTPFVLIEAIALEKTSTR
jgi:hypothetical protein